MELNEQARAYVAQMTRAEKAALCTGADFWHLNGVARLGLKGITVADGPHGLRKQLEHHDSTRPSDSVPATCFPTASAAACTFDPELAFEMGRAIGEECRAEGVSVLLGPGVNLKRSPLCGRNFEYFSEDPYLAGRLAAAMILGLQSVGVGAALKHFAANSQETARQETDSVIDERALREIYLSAFEYAVQHGRPWCVMTAYNRLNGSYCGEHPALLELLRREWGYRGVVVSDWGGVHEIVPSLAAGMDLEMPGVRNGHREQVLGAVESGALPEAALDQAAEHVTALLLRAAEGQKKPYVCDLDAHHALALRIACAAAVLLKNEGGLLPGRAAQKTLVIGQLAREGRYQGSGSSRIHPCALDCAWDALARRIPDCAYEPGYDLRHPARNAELCARAAQAARGRDIVYLFAGLPEEAECEGFDRERFALPPEQVALIEAVCRANPDTVVLLQAGSPVELSWEALPRAILMLYLGGGAHGEAAARLLLGEQTPCGRLAETFPLTLADTPAAGHYPAGRVAQYRESLYTGYRFYDAAARPVRYPFGYGLSYTTFAYRDLTVETREGGELLARCRVKNTGARAGCEIAQLYVAPLEMTAFHAPAQLAAMAKVYLEPGEEKEVLFRLERRCFAFYDVRTRRFAVEGGRYALCVGASSRDFRLRQTVTVPGDAQPLDQRAALPHYYKVDGTFPKAEFETLLGRPVPRYRPPQKGEYTLNSTFGELARGVPGRVLFRVLRLFARRAAHGDAAQTERICRMLADTPLRQGCQSGIPEKLLRAFAALCNGDYRRALREAAGPAAQKARGDRDGNGGRCGT